MDLSRYLPKSWSEYPPGYNPEVHGPFDPSRYYGKPDTPFSQVKIKDLGAWLSRRDKSPGAMARAISRAWWRFQLNWVAVRKPGSACLFQMAACLCAVSYFLDYHHIRHEKHYRYH